eukprot:15462257-Alexandrium_andersonii.AAC.1
MGHLLLDASKSGLPRGSAAALGAFVAGLRNRRGLRRRTGRSGAPRNNRKRACAPMNSCARHSGAPFRRSRARRARPTLPLRLATPRGRAKHEPTPSP